MEGLDLRECYPQFVTLTQVIIFFIKIYAKENKTEEFLRENIRLSLLSKDYQVQHAFFNTTIQAKKTSLNIKFIPPARYLYYATRILRVTFMELI